MTRTRRQEMAAIDPKPSRKRRLGWIVAGAILAAVVAWWFLPPGTETPRATIIRPYQSLDVTFSPDGKTLASGGPGLYLESIDGPVQRRILPLSDEFPKDNTKWRRVLGRWSVESLVWPWAFSPDGSRIVASNNDYNGRGSDANPFLRVWDVAGQRLETTLPLPRGSQTTDASHSNGWFGFADRGRILQAAVRTLPDQLRILRWQAQNWQPLPEVVLDDGWGVYHSFIDDGSAILTIKEGWSTAVVYDLPSGQLRSTLTQTTAGEVTNRFSQILISPDGRAMTSCIRGTSLQIWDIPSASIVAAMSNNRAKQGSPWLTAFSPDSRTLAMARECDGAVLVWDVASAKLRATIAGSDGRRLYAMAFSPDNRTFATVHVEILADGMFARLIRTARPWLTRIGLSLPIGPPSASLMPSGRVQFFDATTGKRIAQFVGTQNQIQSIRFSPDGRTLATTGPLSRMDGARVTGDNATMLWDVPPEASPSPTEATRP